MALQGTESIDGIHKINIKELVSKKSKKKTPEQSNLIIPPYTLKYDSTNSLLKINPYSKFTNVQGFNQYADSSALSQSDHQQSIQSGSIQKPTLSSGFYLIAKQV